jgi:hypothetical protein
MDKIHTTIEESKKLIELGIDVNTADIIYNIFGESYIRHDTPIDKYHTPAWSLSALIKMFDDKAGLARDYGLWYCYDNGKSHRTKHYDSPIDAAFEMVCWLLENKKI